MARSINPEIELRPMRLKHSSVQQSAWGETITLSSASNGSAGSIGSCSNTSSPAPAIRRSVRCFVSAA